MRIVILAPHFAEYSTRLATALRTHADVLLINEATNLTSECGGLVFDEKLGQVARATYSGRVAMGGGSLRRSLAHRRVRRRIEAFRPDILHVQEQGDTFTASIVDHFVGVCPIVLTVHDPVPHSGNDTLVAERFAAGLGRLRAAASGYHVHGTYCENVLRQRLETSKPMAATVHGVILEPSPAQTAEAEHRLLFFGRMEAYKGLDTLLDAIDLLNGEAGFRFVFAGRGPELDRFRGRIAANPAIELNEKFLPPADAIREFQRARAVVVPYRDATQSGVISAAFGNGRPVIATRVGGLVDSVAHGTDGRLVPPDDPEALAEAIRHLSDPSASAKLAEGARAARAGRFAWEDVAERLHALYVALLAPRAGAVGTGSQPH